MRGLTAYLTHDKGTEEDRRPKTSRRVAWTHTINLPTEDVVLAAKIIQGQIYDAPARKKAAGIGPGGRKLRKPIAHFIVAWHPDENPTPQQMKKTALEAASALGLQDHPLMLIAHRDTEHKHVHVVGSRVDPETGRALKMHNPMRTLSRWAAEYEQGHGGIVVPGRLKHPNEPDEEHHAS